MTRTTRLLELMHLLRAQRVPVQASQLATKLSVSVRTLYRDINTLREQGADIQGEAGIGFLLKSGFTLPPLMFTPDEIEALVLGGRWVKTYGDDALMTSAASALTKIRAVSSQAIQHDIDTHTLFVPPTDDRNLAGTLPFAPNIRAAIRDQQKIEIRYEDAHGDISERTICPFALAFWSTNQVVAAWCELRADFRHFRVDRILELMEIGEMYTPNKQILLERWRVSQGICGSFDSP